MILRSVFTRHLTCYTWHVTSDTDTWHVILDIWFLTPALGIHTGTRYLTPIFTMLYLTYDTWHRYLPCYIWHLISDTGTCHAILDTWYITPVLDMLYLTPDTCITWHMHDYYIITRHLILLNSCTPELLYTWTPEIGRPLILLLILYSCWPP